jgi:hypothetical protein
VTLELCAEILAGQGLRALPGAAVTCQITATTHTRSNNVFPNCAAESYSLLARGVLPGSRSPVHLDRFPPVFPAGRVCSNGARSAQLVAGCLPCMHAACRLSIVLCCLPARIAHLPSAQ